MKRLRTRWIVWQEVTRDWSNISVNACGLGVRFDSKRDAMRIAKGAAGQAQDDERISVVPTLPEGGIDWDKKHVVFTGARFTETAASRRDRFTQ